jgi:hypothetical protein
MASHSLGHGKVGSAGDFHFSMILFLFRPARFRALRSGTG